MAYSEEMAVRIREILGGTAGISEKKMFGGLAFMLNGNMCCGINGDDLMLRVGAEAYEAVLDRPHAREMDFTGRAMKGMIYVGPEGMTTQQHLEQWVELAVRFVETLPPK